jgi:hypothetical protein
VLMGAAVKRALNRGRWCGLFHSTCPTPAVCDKTRTALIFLSALNHFEFVAQSESFVEFFPIKFFENLF